MSTSGSKGFLPSAGICAFNSASFVSRACFTSDGIATPGGGSGFGTLCAKRVALKSAANTWCFMVSFDVVYARISDHPYAVRELHRAVLWPCRDRRSPYLRAGLYMA